MKLATLLYIKNQKGEYLLQRRAKNPNRNLLSPPGGKLDIENAESPPECAVREAYEECSLETKTEDWKLIGIITEKNFPEIGSIMIFLMQYRKSVDDLPSDCVEGSYHFIHPENFREHELPQTDKKYIWNNVLNYSGDIFYLRLDCSDYPEIKELKN